MSSPKSLYPCSKLAQIHLRSAATTYVTGAVRNSVWIPSSSSTTYFPSQRSRSSMNTATGLPIRAVSR